MKEAEKYAQNVELRAEVTGARTVRKSKTRALVRARLLLADLLEIAGQTADAQSIAIEVLPIARAMRYGRLEEVARGHVDGQTTFSRFQAMVAERFAGDEDVHIANLSDDELRSVAKFTLQSAQWPTARLPLVEEQCFADRRMASRP